VPGWRNCQILALFKNDTRRYIHISKHMKPKHISRFGGGEAVNPRLSPGLWDHFISPAEPGQSLPEAAAGAAQKNGALSSWMGQLIIRLTDPLCSRVPEGYEDEHGFHYGTQPAPGPRC